MGRDTATYELHFTKFDKKSLGDVPGITYREEKVPDGAQGEPLTLTAIVTATALSTLGAYLLRKYKRESFVLEYEEVRPDGTRIKRRATWKKEDSAGGKLDIAGDAAKFAKALLGNGE